MAYCTQDDIVQRITLEKVIELTDDANIGEVDQDNLDQAIASADAEINSYCGMKYSVPFVTAPPMIRAASVDMAVYHLKGRRQGPSDTEKERYRERIAWLKDVAKGIATLGESDPDGVPTEVQAPEIASNTRVFSRETMSGW
jgi:phage gp36-like protein